MRPEITLYHFSTSEFRDWWPLMDLRLLILLDALRNLHGRPIVISPADGAIGRRLGRSSDSDHNVDMHGRVLGVDTMPADIDRLEDIEEFIQKAKNVGFTAIGIYPHWNPSKGVHLGTRPDRHPTAPALWGALKKLRKDNSSTQTYVSQQRALLHWERPPLSVA